MFSYVPSMLVVGDRLFTVQDKTGIAGCFDAATGKEVWTQRLGGEFYSSPVLIDGKVYLPKNNGDIFVFPAAPMTITPINTIRRCLPFIAGAPSKSTPRARRRPRKKGS